MWEALAQMGSALMLNRHQDMFNRKAANVAFDRQNMLRNTAHQAEVADLRKAGLNPILSVSKGGPGASTPSVAAPSGTSGGGGIDFAGASAKTAQTELTKSQQAVSDMQVQLVGEQATAARYDGLLKQAQAAESYSRIPNISADTALKLAQVPQAQAQTALASASAKQAEASTETMKQQLLALQEEYKKLRTMGKISESDFGKIMNTLEYMTRSITGGVSGLFGK